MRAIFVVIALVWLATGRLLLLITVNMVSMFRAYKFCHLSFLCNMIGLTDTPPPSRPWSDIPLDLAGLVLDRLPAAIDRVRFASVCQQWRAAAREITPTSPPLPLLMLSDSTAYSFPRSKPLRFPASMGFIGVCGNWLLFSGNGVCFLRDPFTNATIPLPALSRFKFQYKSGVTEFTCLEKEPEMIVTKLSLCSTSSIVAALVILGGVLWIAVCKPGASWWSVSIDGSPSLLIDDIAFHQGKLYAVVSYNNNLTAIDISVNSGTGDVWVSGTRRIIKNFLSSSLSSSTKFLVDSCVALLMVCVTPEKRSRTWPFRSAVATGVEVFKADSELSRWTKVTTIGNDQVLFLSRRQCRAVCVSQFGMPGDRIVFFESDDEENISWHGMKSSRSCSVYDMRDGTVSCHLPSVRWKPAAVHAEWLFPKA